MININFILQESFFRTKAALQLFHDGGLPKTSKAVFDSLKFIRNEWENEANANFNPNRTFKYNKSIQIVDPTPDDPLYGKVINLLKYAQVLEDGMTSAERMRILQTSHQVRINKKGGKYLIIPFRHGTPGTVSMGTPMPEHVHAQAKKLTMSHRMGNYWEVSQQLASATMRDARLISQYGSPSGMGKSRGDQGGVPMAQRFTYQWGKPHGRLKGVGGIHEGMVKFEIEDEDDGRKKHTQYMTFRVMSEHGKPWAGIRAYKIVEKTSAKVKGQVEAILENGFKQDVADMEAAAGN